MKKILTKEELKSAANGGGTNVIKVSTEWCGPCRQMAKVVAEIENELQSKASFYEIDAEECAEDVADELNVRSVPLFLIYRNGMLSDRFVGAVGKDELLKKITTAAE